MTLAIPCDACGSPLRRDVVTLRFSTSSTHYSTSGLTRLASDSKDEYLVCPACAPYVQACIAVLEGRVSAERFTPREMAS